MTVMLRRPPEQDAALVHPPPAPAAPPSRRRLLAGGIGMGGLALALWALWPRPASPPPRAPAPAPAPAPKAAPAAPPFALYTADEATIRDHVAAALTVFRFAPDPRIVVLDFPTLAEQGAMLNRVAALVEKAGLPRDRVLSDAELAAAIRASGDTPATYYLGHDYAADSLARFLALADAGHVALNPEEERLRALLDQLDWLELGAAGALISVPRVPQPEAPALDAAARATMLHHELSHGAFFTDPVYAGFVQAFWETVLTEAERDAMRRFLRAEGYDTGNEALMYNEMQAYLMFTDDRRFFTPEKIGMTVARRGALRSLFLDGMPPSWLRLSLATTLAAAR